MGFVESVSSAYSNWNKLSGRASRSEFWYFKLYWWLACFIIAFVCAALASTFETGIFVLVAFYIFNIIPMFTLHVRRLHDSSKSGLWLLLYLLAAPGALVLFIFYLLPSEMDNKYGPQKKSNIEDML
jgi:uncharacterized membrane protein YhaH (DUF805 family)